ncbi:hypothetical protein B0I73DRAFT_137912 [Yarrowia lipolytica]|nr:hypothetical protein B0I73DRAFT_137912 [Yarrowia lipolytica]RDW46153.1 hypothetical protein B0I74DRAFT_128520 [Yarrowia lipolytica]RDW55326.1 hypothetical protein B0I75DRAFT_126141 [Yarrowia lipolytica]
MYKYHHHHSHQPAMARIKLDLSSDEEPTVSFKRKTVKKAAKPKSAEKESDEEPSMVFKSKIKAVKLVKNEQTRSNEYQQELNEMKNNFGHLQTKEEIGSFKTDTTGEIKTTKKVTFEGVPDTKDEPSSSADFISLSGMEHSNTDLPATSKEGYTASLDDGYDSDLSISEGRDFQDDLLVIGESGVSDQADARRADMAEAIYEAQLTASEDDEEDRRGWEKSQFRSSGVFKDDSTSETKYRESTDHEAHNLALKKLHSVPEIPSLTDVVESIKQRKVDMDARKSDLELTLEQYQREISLIEERQKEVADLVNKQLAL